MKKNFKKLQLEELERDSVEEYKQKKKIPLIVVLDNVRSAQNVGSAFRTADAFCVEAVFLCGISCTPPHKEIQKTALGAQNSVDWQYFATPAELVSELKRRGYYIIAVEQTTNSTKLQSVHVDVHAKYALLFGNEVTGVSDDLLAVADDCVEIPQFGTKHSFNVSVCCGIVLWDFAKHFFV